MTSPPHDDDIAHVIDYLRNFEGAGFEARVVEAMRDELRHPPRGPAPGAVPQPSRPDPSMTEKVPKNNSVISSERPLVRSLLRIWRRRGWQDCTDSRKAHRPFRLQDGDRLIVTLPSTATMGQAFAFKQAWERHHRNPLTVLCCDSVMVQPRGYSDRVLRPLAWPRFRLWRWRK